MMGYMTAKEAKARGFTNHGKYFGLPIWIGDVASDAPIVAAKFAPLEFLLDAWPYINGFLQGLFFPDDEPMFRFLVGKPI